MAQMHWNSNQFNVRSVANTSDTNASLKAAPGAGLAIYITDITLNAGATARTWQLLDGSGGTVLWSYTTVANTPVACVNLAVPIKLTAATALCDTNGGASVGGQIFVNGFVGKA